MPDATSSKIRVFLLDDHEMVRAGVRATLEDTGDFVVVGEAGTAEEAMRRIPATMPEVAILDVRLPDGNGVEVCRDIRALAPDLACIMLTSFSDADAVFDAVMAGAAGYVLKQVNSVALVDSVRRVAAGQSLLDPLVTRKVLDRIRRGQYEGGALDNLTPQERRILDGIGRGLTNRQIGDELFLAEKTVKNYVSVLLTKLGFRRRTEVAALAARLDERRLLSRATDRAD